MILCPKCGMPNENSKYCGGCGTKLPLKQPLPGVCTHCGYPHNPVTHRYCQKCGTPLGTPPKKRPWLWMAVAAAAVLLLVVVLFTAGPKEPPTTSGLPVQPSAGSHGTPEKENAPTDGVTREQGEFAPKEDAPRETIPTQPGRRVPVAVDGGTSHSVILYSDGTVATLGDDTYAQRSTSGWRNITQISTFANHTLGLRSDGTVVAAGLNTDGQCNVDGWRDIVSVAAGSRHSVGVRSDGTVVAAGANDAGQCDVSGWTNVQSVVASNSTTFALTRDGRILTCGSFSHRNMGSWSQIAGLSVSTNHVVACHVNGTVSAAGANDQGQCENIAKWNDTLQVAAGYGFTAGLRSTGKVWVHGCDAHNEHAAMQWTDIVAIGSGTEHILGIRADGTLVAKGTNDCGQCDVYDLNRQLTEG